ncbi:unnamed protein product [Paramecium sonneborni]|uniref:Cyclin N-terminal domain-containing protein n=1 Tax=Paramecium sonneborni TaxID=65129 RepID=A0A8S1RCU7_9CILI|nr:unnamed protein product [Paramecium sonneborni]
MKQWEKQQSQKLYEKRIQHAKAQVPVSNKKKSTKVNESMNSMNSSISGFTNKEKEDKESIPLYKLLKTHQLQQYAQQLISRGYGYDLVKFAMLSDNEVEYLSSDIKVLPGHKVKLLNLVAYIKEMIKTSLPTPLNQSKFRNTSYTKKNSKLVTQQKPKTSQTQRIRPQQQLQQQQQVAVNKLKQMKVTNIGFDFFQDESDYEDEFNQALNQIMEKYKGDTTTIINSNNQTLQNQYSKPILTKTNNFLQPTTTGPLLSDSSRANTKIKSKDDIILVSKFHDDKLITEVKENKLIKNLEKQLNQKRRKRNFEEDDDNLPDLQMSQIKHMYLSYDTGKLTSTLVNLDIEEMSNCLAWAILKHIQFSKRNNYSVMKNSSIPFSMDFRFRGTGMNQQDTSQNPIEEPTQLHLYSEQQQQQQIGLFQSQQISKLDKTNLSNKQNKTLAQISEKTMSKDENDFDVKRQEIKEILKESILHQNQYYDEENDDDYSQNEQDYDVCSEEDIDDQNQYQNQLIQVQQNESESFSPIKPKYIQPQQQQLIKVNNISEESLQHIEDSQKIYNYSQSMPYQDQQSLFQSKFDFIEMEDDDKEIKLQYQKIYFDHNSEQVIPTPEVVSNYCKNIIITSKMEKEVTILCLVYIERLLTLANISLEPQTWKRVVLISLIIASKIWDDESFENDNFAKVFPQYRTKDINEMERIFLILLDYKLQVYPAEYAKYYFILRMYTESKKRSFPLRPLDLNTIMKLQKQSNQAEYGLKQKYAQSLNKSF